MSPMGTERRFSRSPRSTRSRSADVDRLRKYAERIEERRNTEGSETTRLYATRWLNLPKSPNFYDKSPDSRDSLEITESHEKLILRKSSGSRDDPETSRGGDPWRESMQSDSDVTSSNNDVQVSPDGGTLSFRWVPLPRIGDRPQHSQKSLDMEFQGARYAASKWITFAKHPSPASSRSSLDRKSSLMKFSSYYDRELRKYPKKQESVVSATADDSSGQISPNINADTKVLEKNESSKGPAIITQRLHDLYKFRFDRKRSSTSSRGHRWSKSKSSSDDEDESTSPTSPKYLDGRRGSQDLEFNERNDRNPRRNPRFSNLKSSFLKKFNEKLRFSEDLGVGRDKTAKYERKAFSEDYGEPQGSQRESWPSKLDVDDNEGHETESTDTSANVGDRQVKERRRGSGGIVKHSSVEYKSSSKRIEAPARSLSYGAEGRPSTPVPPVEDALGDCVPSKFSYLRQKRKSTRYKVYLT
ncbi:uncharacterized protein LOC107048098 isoform X2 [Diachasma alloeum]|uniref:uncharacterized protein LOC107048098 isoform X2 n=1 Tax=Diachasma alloeum TaxID=454923 RepID=UPI0007382E0B|nr:uncharacterized protein LOC107048098 isoform X2 [Diachasma alloeum]